MKFQAGSKQERLRIERKSLTKLSDEESQQLNQFIIKYGGTPFHEIPFNRIASEYFGTDAVTNIAHNETDETVGICTIHFQKKGILKIGYSGLCNNEVPYGGWIYDKEKTHIKELMPLTSTGKSEKIYYYSNICFEDEPYYKENGFTEKTTVVIDLSIEPDDYFETGINSHTRNKIRKAQKSGVSIRYLGLDELDKFKAISGELKDRVGMQNEFVFYRKVFEHYSHENKCTCIAAEHENEIISAGIMLANQNVSVGWVAARKTDLPNNLYQNELLLWDSIIWSKDKGCRYFDLSGLEEDKLPHLARIKLSISKDVRHFYTTTLQSLPVRIINRIQTGR